MSGLLTPKKTDRGWVVETPPERAEALGIAEGSLVVLYAKSGSVEVEILPPFTRNERKSAPDSRKVQRGF